VKSPSPRNFARLFCAFAFLLGAQAGWPLGATATAGVDPEGAQLEKRRLELEERLFRRPGYDPEIRGQLWSVCYRLRRLDDLLRMIEEEPDGAIRGEWQACVERLIPRYGTVRIRPAGDVGDGREWNVSFVRVRSVPDTTRAGTPDRFVQERFEEGLRESLESDSLRSWSGDLPAGSQRVIVGLDPWSTGLSYRCHLDPAVVTVTGDRDAEAALILESKAAPRWLLWATWGIVLLAPLLMH